MTVLIRFLNKHLEKIKIKQTTMKKAVNNSEASNLRKKAIGLLKKKQSNSVSQLSEPETLKLIHELEVHQIELELQNEELRLARSAEQHAAEKYTELYDFAPSGYFTLSKEGKIIELNLCGSLMLGKERSRLINSLFGFFISDDTKPVFSLFLAKVFNSKAKETCEVTLSAKGNLPMYVYLTGIVTENTEQCIVTVIDITERKQAEEELIQSEIKFHSIFDNSPVGSVIVGLDNRFIRCNSAFCNFLGYSENELIGKTIADITYPEDLELGMKELNQIVEGKIDSFTLKKRYLRKDGNIVWGEISISLIHDANNKPVYFLPVIKDITLRKHAEELLLASEVRYRRLFESAKEGILILDAETGKIMDVNPFLIKMLSYSEEQFNEKIIWEIGLFKDIAANQEKFLELKQKKYVRYEDLPLETADGRKIDVEFISNIFSVNHHKVIQCNIRDITERKRSEAKLREKELQYRNLANSGMALIRTSGTNKLCNYFNEPWLNFTGRSFEQAMDIGWAESIYPDDFDRCLKTYLTAFDTRQAFDMEYRLHNVSGEYRWIRDLGTPNYNSDGEFIGYILQAFDITQHKQAEQDLIKAKVNAEESDRLKTAFLANMSHEIRTPMNGILGFTELLKEAQLTSEIQQRYISIIEKSGARMLNIINDIISISKVESGQMEVYISETNINEQIEYIYTFFKPSVEQKGIQFFFKNSLTAIEATIKTDREKVYAILTNLVKNAIKFTNAGSIIFGYKKKGEFLEFFVKDTGAGISREQKEIVFERFRQGSESLSRNFEGAGLGLSISKAYVEMLGGKIWVESDVGKGSTFYFTIPYNAKPEAKLVIENVVSADGEEKQIKKLKILIAEDDEPSEMLLAIAVEIFSKEILTVRTGIETVETCRNNPDIDLVLMDIQLPEMDGYEATRQIRDFNKEVIIIAETANALSDEREKAIEAGCNDYISKPFSQSFLRGLILKQFKK
jgi:PAS domain S-box-containing protein